MITANVVQNKGAGVVKKMLVKLGHKQVVLRRDTEPAIMALKEAVRRPQ